jgi:hypothetical protein
MAELGTLCCSQIQTARAQANAPEGQPLLADPLNLPVAVNVQNFKEAMIVYTRILGGASPIENTCVPYTLSQNIDVGVILRELDLDEWNCRIIAVAIPNMLPIVCVYVPRSRYHTFDISK